MNIEMTLIEKKGQPARTQLKIKKTDVPSFRMLDGLKPDKTTRYYNYYILDGDLLNPRKIGGGIAWEAEGTAVNLQE